MDLGLEIQKAIVGIRISILDIQCVPIFIQNEQLWIFWLKFVQKKDLGFKTGKKNVGIRINIVETLLAPFSAKLGNFNIFGPNLPKKEIMIWNSGN